MFILLQGEVDLMKYTIICHKKLNWTICLKSNSEELHKMWKNAFSRFDSIDLLLNAENRKVLDTISVVKCNEYYKIENLDLKVKTMAEAFGLAFDIALSDSLNKVDNYVFLHGAAVEKNGMVDLIIANTLGGKSTLSALLCLKGYNYLSDDVIPINCKTLKAQSFPKPIFVRDVEIIKKYNKDYKLYFDVLDDKSVTYNRELNYDRRDIFVPNYTCNCEKEYEIRRIIFIGRDVDLKKTVVLHLDKANTYYQLLKNMRNAKLTEEIKMCIADLTKKNQAFELKYSAGYNYLSFF